MHLENDNTWSYSRNQKYTYKRNGKVVAKFTLKKIDDIGKYAYTFKDYFFYETLKKACLTTEDLIKYANVTREKFERKGMKLYAWHISDLVIFDKPRELGEFKQCEIPYPKRIKWPSWESNYYTALGAYVKQHPTMLASEIKRTFDDSISVKRAPQSWCYVEELR